MKCYVCAKNGIERDAVGVCIVCGMGVCMEHATLEEITFWEAQSLESSSVSGSFGGSVAKKIPRILCPYCVVGLSESKGLGDLPDGSR